MLTSYDSARSTNAITAIITHLYMSIVPLMPFLMTVAVVLTSLTPVVFLFQFHVPTELSVEDAPLMDRNELRADLFDAVQDTVTAGNYSWDQACNNM